MPALRTPEKMKLLVVDDDKKLCRLIASYLEPFGYTVTAVHTGPEGLAEARQGEYHAVVLDVMLPGMDGFELLQELRTVSNVPVLMLTSRGDETDRIVGLEMGADDYLPKTFSTRELLARLRAVTRRSASQGSSKAPRESALVAGPVRIEPSTHSAYLADTRLALTPVELQVLTCLVRAQGRVLSREGLLEQVIGRDYDVFDRSIDVHISALRRKLGDDPSSPRFIKTVRSAGYMFVEQTVND